jgi:hypothetical protein
VLGQLEITRDLKVSLIMTITERNTKIWDEEIRLYWTVLTGVIVHYILVLVCCGFVNTGSLADS